MFPFSSELRSVTALCVVEDVSKCPLGYTPILRTHDLEADADLWKDGLFSRRVTRYVCISKTQGRPEHVVESIQIIHDRELPPEGYSIIAQTSDSSQKAFKKKHLCYKVSHFKSSVESVVDLIILSKLKNPPDGYDPIGDINGMHFCVRKISAITRLSTPGLSYGILPGHVLYPKLNDSMGNISLNESSGSPTAGVRGNGIAYPMSASSLNNSVNSSPVHGMNQLPGYPGMPLQRTMSNTGTGSNFFGLEGIPFMLREDLKNCKNAIRQGRRGSMINVKSQYDLDNQYNYDFRTERDALIAEM
ncbi:Multivesicular body subunit 12B [Orchesella cincta]|uniref:Multivesicular body subunit 12A n=1 Tax=Orchesella cincta TaxID=48709 RepID=A0A1D2MZD2_ORCCI|nr:Multivesicular body subunit 12B [Orchesella cincta]